MLPLGSGKAEALPQPPPAPGAQATMAAVTVCQRTTYNRQAVSTWHSYSFSAPQLYREGTDR